MVGTAGSKKCIIYILHKLKKMAKSTTFPIGILNSVRILKESAIFIYQPNQVEMQSCERWETFGQILF